MPPRKKDRNVSPPSPLAVPAHLFHPNAGYGEVMDGLVSIRHAISDATYLQDHPPKNANRDELEKLRCTLARTAMQEQVDKLLPLAHFALLDWRLIYLHSMGESQKVSEKTQKEAARLFVWYSEPWTRKGSRFATLGDVARALEAANLAVSVLETCCREHQIHTEIEEAVQFSEPAVEGAWNQYLGLFKPYSQPGGAHEPTTFTFITKRLEESILQLKEVTLHTETSDISNMTHGQGMVMVETLIHCVRTVLEWPMSKDWIAERVKAKLPIFVHHQINSQEQEVIHSQVNEVLNWQDEIIAWAWRVETGEITYEGASRKLLGVMEVFSLMTVAIQTRMLARVYMNPDWEKGNSLWETEKFPAELDTSFNMEPVTQKVRDIRQKWAEACGLATDLSGGVVSSLRHHNFSRKLGRGAARAYRMKEAMGEGSLF